MIFNGKKAQEKGSIMLEVIAVLALMGVMGAMLFRQIYLRNQELHNVQMASEMRTVKEAFSAALQARAQEVLSSCTIPASAGTVSGCTADFSGYIKQYLPDGWFAETASGDASGTELKKYYRFYTFIYKQEDSSQKVKMYGMVVPKAATLPATGWNFKRAARVALLIGADGGAYGPGITKEGSDTIIAGALGSWTLSATSPIAIEFPKIDGTDTDLPTYVAVTGLDVFTPEYDVPEVSLNIPGDDLEIQFDKLGAASLFMAGYGTSNCVGTIKHSGTTADANGIYEVKNDTLATIGTNCLPTFWVEEETSSKAGQVYTRNDLNIGYDESDPGNSSGTKAPAIKLRKDGVIVFSSKYKDGQDDGTADEKPYILDPAYTSVMNDIKLTSRGGARLSDILPTYILKSQKEISNANGTIAKPTCPEEYKKALVVLPTTWNPKELNVNVPGLTIPEDREVTKSVTVSRYVTDDTVTIPVLTSKGVTTNSGIGSTVAPGVCVKIGGAEKSTEEVSNTGDWTIILGRKSTAGCEEDSTVHAIVQTYCVYDSASFPTIGADFSDRTGLTQAECSKIGGKFDATKQTCKLP